MGRGQAVERGDRAASPSVSEGSTRNVVFAEMATDRIADFVTQQFHGIGLGENRFAKGTGDEPAFIGFFDEEYDFLHGVSPTVGRHVASVRAAKALGPGSPRSLPRKRS